MKSIDYLIVGGGIAGLTIATYLEKENQNFLIVNQDLEGAATKVSSGVINPVTGQRFVLSWKYEELKSEFIKFYKSLEIILNEKLIVESKLTQILHSVEEQNAWLSRTADPIYQKYFGDVNLNAASDYNLPDDTTTATIKSIYLIQIDRLLEKLENQYQQQGRYESVHFNFNDFKRTKVELHWKDIEIKKAIIFAEGFRIVYNPYFNWLPVIPLKGECLHIEIPESHIKSVFKAEYAIVPISNSEYWCGSNFYLFETELSTSQEEKQNQIDFLNRYLKHPFNVKKHVFGIRPASRDRRPILGPHSQDPRLIVFNGLGTKGLSLAPYCAQHLVQYLLYDIPIPKELNLLRFKSKGFEASTIS